MKKIFLLFTLAILFNTTGVIAQTDRELDFSNVKITREGENVNLEFTITAGKRAAAANYVVRFVPYMETGEIRTELPVVAVIGKRAKLTHDRHGNLLPQADVTLHNGETAIYRASVPFSSVNNTSRLLIEGVSIGCCSEQSLGTTLLAESFVNEGTVRIEPLYVERKLTTGDKLSQQYAFLANIDEFEAQKDKDRDQYIDETRDQSLTVYFYLAGFTIDLDFRDNRKTLNDLVSAINSISGSADTRVSHIVIAGYASPEGSTDANRRLAYSRAVSLRDYLLEHTSVDVGLIDIHNGAVDWKGFRREIEKSSVPEKLQILDILDNVPVWDSQRNLGRHGELMRLNGGRPYQWIRQNIFPELRNATYIRVYYEHVGRP